jgi:hypothetical protein
MLPFPEECELVSVFEGEPTLADPELPWVYNRLQFSVSHGGDQIECTIEPSSRQVDFTYTIDGRNAVTLGLRRVAGLRTYKEGAGEGIVVLMEDATRGELTVQVSPDIRLTWREELT